MFTQDANGQMHPVITHSELYGKWRSPPLKFAQGPGIPL